MLATVGWLAGISATHCPAAALTPAQISAGKKVTAELNRILKKVIKGPPNKVQIRVLPAQRADLGYFSEIFISAKPAKINHRKFSELVLRARNVRISPHALLNDGKILTLTSVTSLRALITEDEVTQALAKGRDSKNKDLRVTFDGGKVHVTGRWQWSWFSGPMDATGQLRLGSNHTVIADIQDLKLNGKEVPEGMKNKFSEKINPLIDYNDLPFRPPFKSIRFHGKTAVIST
jgi:hypothetical protein